MNLRRTGSVLFLMLVVVSLEIFARLRLVSPHFFPPISTVLEVFLDLFLKGLLPMQVMKSLNRMGWGFILAVLTMIPLGVFAGINRRCYLLLEPLLELLRPIPPPVIIPVAMLFLGIGDGMKIFVVFFACSFPILTNAIDGARSVHPLFIQTGKSLGLNRLATLGKIILPAASPQIMAGLRTSLPICMIVAILSEMIGGEDGIGYWTLHMQRTFSIPQMYAGVLMTGLLGYLANRFLLALDRRFLEWHKCWRKAGG